MSRLIHAYSAEVAQEALLRRQTLGDDRVSVNVEIWSGREEVLRASACPSSEGQGRGSPKNGNRTQGSVRRPIRLPG